MKSRLILFSIFAIASCLFTCKNREDFRDKYVGSFNFRKITTTITYDTITHFTYDTTFYSGTVKKSSNKNAIIIFDIGEREINSNGEMGSGMSGHSYSSARFIGTDSIAYHFSGALGDMMIDINANR